MHSPNYQIPCSSLLIALLASFASAQAQEINAPSIQNVGALQYTGASSRLGIGYQNSGTWQAEVSGVLIEKDNVSWLGEAWFAKSSGGAAISYHQLSNDVVTKYFIGFDQNAMRDRKISLGYGQETENLFGHIYLSHSPGSQRLVASNLAVVDSQVNGVEAGRSYIDTISTTTTTRTYERAYDNGLGMRLGHYYSSQDIRLAAGLDYEWGGNSAKQVGISLTAEKFFLGTPHSVAVQVGQFRKTGDVEAKQSDNRVSVMYRYNFGKNTTQPAHQYRMVAEPAVKADPIIIPARTETRLIKTSTSMSGDAFFVLASAKLTDAAKTELDRIADILKKHPRDGKVRIVGHTCDLGSTSLNERLSLQRATAVRDYFIAQGILGIEDVILEAKGKSQPKYPQSERERNRRVDMEFVSIVDKEELIEIPEQIQQAPEPIVTYKREEITQEPAWIKRAMRTSFEHKRTVDTYRSQQQTQSESRTRAWKNRAPQANADTYEVLAGSVTSFAVLSNDSDPDPGDSISLVSVSSAPLGQVRIEGAQLVYTAPSNFKGQVAFSYVIKDSQGLTSSANVTVNVVLPNQAPIAKDDWFRLSGVKESLLDPLANDSDPDGDELSLLSVTQPSKGTGTVRIVGKQVLFTPFKPFFQDSFTYTISDGRGGQATATAVLFDP
ncbi:Ig-like domain-containing protein [Undibacterium sp. Jales W-56]|uniref:Ig-like domain-containing protein n=1 Tax=Undibacterium sp. Jales W-56 TaxID=2897325 RepID=UPI0021D2646B|nr:Ig-like domain-containing protein [Undibacterium sp. Jales W-56]MCU6434443.1 Ig-like domain-containing protein [Undibacterium sp. Jales W-56]